MEFLKGVKEFVCFAPIDLKLADLYIRDGWTTTGVTNTSTEPLGETSVALTGCSENVPVGATVHFANDSTDTEYVVESRTTTGGVNAVFTLDLDSSSSGSFTLTYDGQTTNSIAYDATAALIQLELEALDGIGNGDVLVAISGDITITFQDDLAATPISAAVFTFAAGTLNGAAPTFTLTTPGVVDGTTTAIVLTEGLAEEVAAGGAVTFTGRRLDIKIGEGNLTYTEAKTREYIPNRGRIGTANGGTIRDGVDEPMTVSFEFVWEWITGVTASGIPTIEDALKQRGEAALWETTSTDPCEPYCVDLEIHYDPACGGANSEVIVLPEFRWESLAHDLSASTISCEGKCNVVEATVTRG